MKVLVTTDLSKNSIPGIKFAIQLASQNKASLIFYQVIDIPRPTRWSDQDYEQFVKREKETATAALCDFVAAVYKHSGVRPGKFSCVVEVGSPIGESIIAYASKIKAQFICMGTRGAGTLRRIFGTQTSAVLTHSPIPVLAVPKNYRQTRITHLLYATDLTKLSGELKKIQKIAESLKAKISILHYDYLYQLKEAREKLAKTARKYQTPGVKIYFEKLNIEKTLDAHLRQAARRYKPSIVVLFTNQHRDWYERLFLPSNSAAFSFDTKKPLLVFPKKD